jgi:hypothetical protein
MAAGCTAAIEGPGPGGSKPTETATPGPGPVVTEGIDPGRVGIHRLNNAEYDNTVRELLGTSSYPSDAFPLRGAETGINFDNTATALGMLQTQYEAYMNAAEALMAEAIASDAQRGRFMTCTPAIAGDACARQIIGTFGMQIYRRPLEAAEVERAMKVYDADIARNQSGTQAVGQALRAMLSAANFLYRIELDPEPSSLTPHALSSYELASRLSYLHWSSMPDAALFAAAQSGELLQPAVLEQTVDRMLADAKGSAFVQNFAGQWLNLRELFGHSVTPSVFPTYTPELADAMAAEGYQWFQDFLTQDRSLSEWFTADFNYVNGVLAQHYGFPAPANPDQLSKVQVTTDRRQGFLGLASFLTHTSVPSRTSPTERGYWVLSNLLCTTIPQPPGKVPDLKESASEEEIMQPSGSENVREQLERHRVDPGCASCHKILDPIGLGLERYDGIGRYRETYGNGETIIADGVLPEGATFSGPQELGAVLSKDSRFTACAANKLLTYALGRDVEAETLDLRTMQKLHEKWAARGLNLKNLIKEVVLSDAFRFRRGEPE